MEAESLIFVWFVAPAIYHLWVDKIQQNDSNGGEAVCHDNIKIEGEKLVQLEGERVCPAVCRG